MYLENLLPRHLAALAAPGCLVHRLLHPELVSFGLMANLRAQRGRGAFDGVGAIVDVGANIGQFAYMVSRTLPGVPVVSIEPEPESYARLQATFARFGIPGRCIEAAASDRAGEGELHRHAERVNSSLLSAPAAADRVRVRLAGLDELLEGVLPAEARLLLKLDVQGYEMRVLASAERTLARCAAVIVEVAFEPAYEGAAAPAEVIAWLAERGFALHDLLDTLRRPAAKGGGLREADLLFLRRP